MKSLLLVIFVVLISFQLQLFSQDCLQQGNDFTSQAQIDSFQFDFPGCTKIEGDVTINGNSDISNLNGLSVLESFGGDLIIIQCNSLSSLQGLDNIISIGGDFTLSGNIVLANLSNLNKLETIQGSFRLNGNNELIDLSGLSSLSYIKNNISIESNLSLTNLIGLENLTNINGSLLFLSNSALKNLSGLNNVTSIGGFLRIGEQANGNSSLINLSGLEKLTTIGENLEIWDNDGLTTLVALNNLVSVGGNVSIGYNDNLTMLTGLDNIYHNSIVNLNIGYNYLLTTCDVESICNYLSAQNGEVWIENNAMGCNSLNEVQLACDTTDINEFYFNNGLTISLNPCSGFAIVQFSNSDEEYVNLDLFELSGLKVLSLLHEKKLPGSYEIEINLNEISAGIYFCVFQSGTSKQIKKIIII